MTSILQSYFLGFSGFMMEPMVLDYLSYHSPYEYVALETILSNTETIFGIAKLIKSKDWSIFELVKIYK